MNTIIEKNIRNRKKSSYLTEIYDIKNIIEHQKLLFNLYINKRYYYCGGNNGEHLRYFRTLYYGKNTPKYPSPDDAYCYICERSLSSNLFKKDNDNDMFLWEPSEVFYIYDLGYKYNIKSQTDYNIFIIGRCCLSRFIPERINTNKISMYILDKYKLKKE